MEENGMSVEKIGAAFGLGPEDLVTEEPGAEETDMEETGWEGAQEDAEDAGIQVGDPLDLEDEEVQQGGAQAEAEGREMPAEERHRQAAARRAREEEARQAAEQARVDAIYQEMFQGQTNPFTGRPIQGEADYRDYQAKMEERRQQDQLEQAGIDPGTIQSMVQRQMEPLQRQVDYYQMREAQAQAAAVNQRAEAAIRQSLRNISAQMPEVQTLEDLAALPTAPAFNDMVQRGYSLEDAFYLANREALNTRAAKAARAAERNGAASKRHLSTGAGGDLPMDVPREAVQMYREFMPGATDEEIRAAYKAEMKQ